MSQFIRKVKVIIKSVKNEHQLVIETLRVVFKVNKTASSKDGNTANIEIYNLSFVSRGIIDDVKQSVELLAGYAEDTIFRTIFKGDIQTIIHDYEAPDWITRIRALDGSTTTKDKKVSVTGGKGTKILDILKDAIMQSGVGLKNKVEDFFRYEEKNKK